MKVSSVTFGIVHEDDDNPAELLHDMIMCEIVHRSFEDGNFEDYVVTEDVVNGE